MSSDREMLKERHRHSSHNPGRLQLYRQLDIGVDVTPNTEAITQYKPLSCVTVQASLSSKPIEWLNLPGRLFSQKGLEEKRSCSPYRTPCQLCYP